MKLAGAEEIQDGAKRTRMAVKEVLVVHQGVVVTQLHQGLMRVALAQPAQPRMRQSV